ncbi:hypothetical protein [Nonomuraea dietziae]|uniref:hypothetical protein n=1 Tax=Nonomuraea dietziae TaxID=65515 RepID=UPI0033DBBD7E
MVLAVSFARIRWQKLADFTQAQVPLIESVARQGALVVDHARLYGAHPRRQFAGQPYPPMSGMRRDTGSPAIAIATSMSPRPIAGIPSEPAAACVAAGADQRLAGNAEALHVGRVGPGFEYHSPNRWQAERRKVWSSAFLLSVCSGLWSTYCTDTSESAVATVC